MSTALKTDLYQLTMLAALYRKNLYKKIVTCEAFVRKLPPERKFLIMAGTEEIRNFLLDLRFSREDIKQLKELQPLKNIFITSNFDKFLEDFRFSGSMWALAEGEIAFAGEPLVQITGTLVDVHMAETFVLSILNHDVKIASKAARIVLAARGRPVLELGTRRTHHEAAINAARSAYLAGFAATSNVEAAIKYKIPIAGTMSHMWIMTHKNELQAFQNFQDIFKTPTLLIDTYDTIIGAINAAKVSSLNGVRLDSGDFKTLSSSVRDILDKAGAKKAKIIVSGDLNEYSIDDLICSGAPIDTFAVGTELVLSTDVPSLGIVFKVVYDHTENRPLIKLSPGKTTFPGKKQIFLDQRNGGWSHLISLENAIQQSEYLSPLLDCHISNGKKVENCVVNLEISRKYCNAAMVNLHPQLASLKLETIDSPVYPDDSLKNLYEEAVNGLSLVVE
ncbi:MAG: nicotinate phosphoribosyltransferase [Patescibacteria group bacterium]|jgi:nicotinate phosphoribosyltransferase